ncbi:hypothetical protein Ancab_013967 [Ancistrocladus abbreviatus]
MNEGETLRSSSGRRETVPGGDQNTAATTHHRHAKTIGCVAGIFQLVSSKYQNRRKFLTFGRKQEKQEAVSSKKKPKAASEPVVTPPTSQQDNIDAKIKKEDECRELRRLSCEVPRSPTIPPEIRRSISFNSPENTTNTTTRSSPALVARLMGLDEVPTPSTPATPESAAEKRRKLLGALEKCDKDLKALRRIIEAVRSSELYQTSPTPPRKLPMVGGRSPERIRRVCVESGGNLHRFNFEVKQCLPPSSTMKGGGGFERGVKKSAVELSGEQPSPVSVLDEFNWSPLSISPSPPKHNRNGRMPQQQQQQSRRKPGEDEIASLRFLDRASRATTCSFHPKVDQTAGTAPAAWSSKSAMIDTVNEVCKDIAWGQGREVVKVALVIQDSICRDLIDEISREMACHNLYNSSSLPFQTCKRKHCF